MLDDINSELYQIVKNSTPSLCCEDKNFVELYNSVENMLKRMNIDYRWCMVYVNPYKKLNGMIYSFFDYMGTRYRYEISDKQANHIASNCEKLIEICFPIYASFNEVLSDNQMGDYCIEDKSFLTVSFSESLRRDAFFYLLIFLLRVCKFDLFFKYFKKYRVCLLKRHIKSLVHELINCIDMDQKKKKFIDEVEAMKPNPTDKKAVEKFNKEKLKIQEDLKNPNSMGLDERIRGEDFIEYLDNKEQFVKKTTFFDDSLEKADYNTLTGLLMLINEFADIDNVDKKLLSIAKHFFVYVDSIILGIDDITLERCKKSSYKEYGEFGLTPYEHLSKMIANLDKDKSKLKSLIKTKKIVDIARFLIEYYVEYISAIKDIAQECLNDANRDNNDKLCCFNSNQRLYISTLHNEVGYLASGDNYCNMERTGDSEIDEIFNAPITDDEINVKLYGTIETSKIISKKIELVLDDIERIKNSDLGKIAIRDKEKYVKEFLASAKDIYDFHDSKDNITDADVDKAYNAIMKNENIMKYLAVGEYNFKLLCDSLPVSDAGDNTYMVITFNKVVERYMKEVLVQYYPNDIHKTVKQHDDAGLLHINDRDKANADAEYLGHKHDGTYYVDSTTGRREKFISMDCGGAYYALLYIRNNVPNNKIGANLDGTYELNTSDGDNKISFYNEWVNKVRNGYAHVDAMSSKNLADEKRRKTAFWFIHLTKCLPKLER